MSTFPDDSRSSLFCYRFGTAEFDEARFELRVDGHPVEVQRKPLEILACLLNHPGEVVTREELLETVWEGRPTVDNVVANAMAKLRHALGTGNAERILTQPRVGYRFDGPLERVAVGRALTSALDLKPGMPVPGRPNFQLESLLGSSGNAEVWLALHPRTRELRVYKFSPGGERLSALKREATLYRVLHDSLGERADMTRVIDWNFAAAPFFLECEYGGRNLAEWALAGDQLASLTLQERVALFLQIADAVAAAHSVGVLHKDLKPANVLIAARPEGGWQVRLTDFGSGRLLEAERLADLGITRMGMTVTRSVLADSRSGTPLYLAPELIAGQAPTVQSDLYSLGVMLYQMVVADLRKPMVPGWERGIADPLLREDIAQATDGDPARRPRSVAELAQRLRALESRHQERQRAVQIEAAARGAAQALQRSRARRPWIIAAGVILAVGCGLSLWLYRGAEQASARADAINDFLHWGVLANTGALKTDDDSDPTMRRVLTHAAASVGEHFGADPGSEGWIRLAIGQGFSGLGDYAAAEQQHRLSVALLERAYTPAHERAVEARYALAVTLLEQSKFVAAEAVLAEVDLMGDHALRSSGTAMKSHALRGMLRATRKECQAALEDFQAAERIELPPSDGATFNLYNVRSWIGQSLNCLGRHEEAKAVYAALLGPEHREEVLGPALIAYARLGYAESLRQGGHTVEAEQEFLRALEAIETRISAVDALTTGQALVTVGTFYMNIGQFDQARGYLTRGQDLLESISERQEKALDARRSLGIIDYTRGQIEAAVDKLGAARLGFAEVFGEASADEQGAAYWLAAALVNAGRIEEAAELAGRLQPEALRTALGGSQWELRLDVLRARILIGQGKSEAGQALLATALPLLRENPMPSWSSALLHEGTEPAL